MVVHVGIDEKRAREICQEMNLQLRKDYSREALEIAHSRVNEFENKLMEKMAQVNGAMEAFTDPSFQLLLLEAQRIAAATERPADYDLLSELLVHRFNKGENRNARAGISLAVEIVDKVSDEALLALTVAHAVNSFFPMTGDIARGLDTLDSLFGKIIYHELPNGQEWLDHLDILNAVRINGLGSMKKLTQFYPEVLHGYIDVGILKDSDDHKKAVHILNENKIPPGILVEHILNQKFVRLEIAQKQNIKNITLSRQDLYSGKLVVNNLSEAQISALMEIYAMYSQDASIKNSNIDSFMLEWNKRPNLQNLMSWWDSISTAFNITSVGRVLAHSNAQRCDRDLPPMN